MNQKLKETGEANIDLMGDAQDAVFAALIPYVDELEPPYIAMVLLNAACIVAKMSSGDTPEKLEGVLKIWLEKSLKELNKKD